jgi:leader peptidase (prepilin peptidase)/N-methyltransferase
MDILIGALAGLLMGHVMDLLFVRFYTSEAIGGPFFRCAKCRKPLRPIYLVPLIGIFASGGRCPDCEERLPARMLVLPIGAALLTAASVAVFEDLGPGLLGGFFATVFLTLTLTDFESRLLPNRIVYPATLIAIAMSWAWPDSSFVDVLAGGLVAIVIAIVLLLLSLIFGPGAFGMGDVKMIILIGFVVGLPSVVVGVFIGTFVAGIASAVLLLTRLRSRGDYIPHGPFLAIGGLVALFWGQDLWDAYTE